MIGRHLFTGIEVSTAAGTPRFPIVLCRLPTCLSINLLFSGVCGIADRLLAGAVPQHGLVKVCLDSLSHGTTWSFC